MTLPRLLAGLDSSPIDYARHRELHGEPHGGRRRPAELLAELEHSGLRGRGGAAFPLSIKVAAVRRAAGDPVLVVNGCEGEPMSSKDRLLLWCAPHLVLDGALSLATAIGARELIVAIGELEPRVGEAVRWAFEQRPERRRMSMRLASTPRGYVSGEESALVRWCNDGVAKPTSSPVRVTDRGIGRRPTLVSNVETLAHLALIERNGSDWFRAVGSDADPGSALVTVSGKVRAPGVYEIEHGQRLSSLLAAAGGAPEPIRAFLVGGYSGSFIDAAHAASVRLSPAELEPLGAHLGPGIVVALPYGACPVAETALVAGWLSDQSAGQCGPCFNGLGSIADALAAVRDGRDGPEALARVARWCELVVSRGACAHPDGAAGLISSALRLFSEELVDHADNGPCDGCYEPAVLHVPGARAATVGR